MLTPKAELMKPTVLFIPGLLNDELLWQHQIHDLAPFVSPVIAYLTNDDSIAAMAERALASITGPFIISSLSMGGYVAFEILRRAGERVRAVALVSTSASPDSSKRQIERKRAIQSLNHGKLKGVTQSFLPKLVHPLRVNSPVGEEVKAMARRVGAQTFLQQQQAILQRADYRSILSQIKIPTLIAVGDSDRLTPPAEARLIRNGIEQSTYHEFTSCGHLPPLECPNETSRILHEWLVHDCGV
jgi:pimeloyl-ACP methyl ester carboxylesterase